MDPLSVAASIVALIQLSSKVIGYLSNVKGGPRELQKLRLEVCTILPILAILQDEVEQAKGGGRWSSTLLSLDVENGPIQRFRVALEQLETKLAPAKGWKKVGKACSWPFEKEEILGLLGIIERQKLLFTLARQNDHIALTKAMKSDFEIVHNKVDEIGEEVTKFQLSDRHHKMRLWLSGVDPSLNYNRALRKRHQSTGKWLIEDAIFRDWKQSTGSDRIIWLYGIPGCGKTILCSTVVEHILHVCATTSDIAVLYFFFDFNDMEKQQHESMMRSLLSQLSMHFVRVPPVLETIYSSCMEGGRNPNFEALKETFRKMATAFRATFIVVDALDECNERPELLADIEEMNGWEDANLRILVTSRREKEIEDSILRLTEDANRICIQSAFVNADIRAYVHGQLRTNRRLQKWQKQPNVQSEIENTLMEKANGMFRWVACQLDVLENCLTLPKLRKTLATLPKTLDDTYARILCNIDDEYQQYALHLLQWLTFSMRPLHLKEIAEVVAIDISENPKFDPQRRLPDPEDVVEICSSLITVTDHISDDDDFNHLYSETYGAYVELAHFSVKEYLISDIISQGKAVKFSLDETDCHVALTKDCLAYLFHFDGLGSLTYYAFAEYPLAQYAALYLPEHTRIAETNENAICQDLFMTKGEAFRNWVRLHDLLCPIGSDLVKIPRSTNFPIHYAWSAGLSESVRECVNKGIIFNAQDEEYGNDLIAGSYLGNIDLVKVLLDEKFYLDTTSSFYDVALRSASLRGHTEIVEMLLKRRPAENEQVILALLRAVEERDEGEAQSLIENGADITRRDYANVDPLELALRYHLRKVSGLILDKRVVVEGEEYTRALVTASKRGYYQMVQMLVDRGAVIDAEVMKAAIDGKTLQVLLDCGGNLDLRDAQGRGLCHRAASQRSAANLRMIVERGADLTVTDKQGRTCLHHASTNHFTDATVDWLLDEGFDANTTDRDGWTPLHWAAKSGDFRKFAILQAAGAKVCRENIMGWTPEDVALFQGLHSDLWKTSTAWKSKSKRSIVNLEDELDTANPKAIVRDVQGLLLLGNSSYCWICDGCNIVSRSLIAPRINCRDKYRIYEERGIRV